MTLLRKQQAMLSQLYYERTLTDDAAWLMRLDDKIIALTAAIEDARGDRNELAI